MSYLCAPFFHEKILLRYAQDLTGCTLGELSSALLNDKPENLININKGFTGRLIEKYLGVISSNQAKQDFDMLGIELKTIPINKKKYPIEDTFICSVPILRNIDLIWENSYFYKKIKRILWVPIQADRNITISKRIIQKPFLWSFSKTEEQLIKKDWEDFIDLIILEKEAIITGEYGQVLRYLKRINKKYTRRTDKIKKLIYSSSIFYFRKQFTYSLLLNHYKKNN